MEHPNAHAVGPCDPARCGTRLPGLAGSALVIAGCAAVALAATPLVMHGAGGGALQPLDPAAAQVTALGPHVVVYSVPTKKGKGGGSQHHKDSGGDSDSGDSGDSGKGSGSSGDSDSSKSGDSSSSGDSGDSNSSGSSDSGSSGSGGTSVSNTVNGAEVGGAQTSNNHTTTGTTGDTGSVSSPVQLKDNTGPGAAGLNSQGGDGVAGTTGLATTNSSSGAVSTAAAVILMRVSCPASVAAGTVCLQVTSVGGASAASLPSNSIAATLPTSTSTSAASLPSTPTGTTLSTGSPTSALGQAVGGGGRVDVSALESQSGKKIELTGYSFQDNQGGNNAKISCPIIHQQAGGTGTYQDPITVASGGKSGGASADGIKCGDRFYLPAVQRYVIVEDTGNTPNKSMPHLDMYVGDDPNKSCMNKISGTVTAIPHPPSGLPVLAGPIGSNGGCKLPGSSGGGQ